MPPAVAKTEVELLREEIAALKEREAKHWKLTENFLSRIGTYYNSDGRGAIFFVDGFVTSGANGVALTPQQGLVEHFALPMKVPSVAQKAGDEKIIGPCWVPLVIPEQAEEIIELFEGAGDVGDNSQKHA